MQLKQGEKIAESQEKVRDDGEDVNERERERENGVVLSQNVRKRIRRELKALGSCMQSFLKV